MKQRPETANRTPSSWRVKLRRQWKNREWMVITVMWAVALILGLIGHHQYFTSIGEPISFWDDLHLTTQLFVLQSAIIGPVNPILGIARFLAPAVALYTAIQAFASIYYEQLRKAKARFYKNHVVICGLGKMGLIISKRMCEENRRVVIIEPNAENPCIEQSRDDGAIVLVGDATDPDLLRNAGVNRADVLVCVCGEDGRNAKVAVNALAIKRGRGSKYLTCFSHIIDLELSNLLQKREGWPSQAEDSSLVFFNIYESGARVFLDEHPPFPRLEEGGADARPHVLIVGLGSLGKSIVINAARNWRPIFDANGRKLRVSVIDKVAEDKVESLRILNPQLDRLCSITPLEFDIASPLFHRADFLGGSGGAGDVTMIYICLDDDSRTLAAALDLHRGLRGRNVPIVMRMTRQEGLSTMLHEQAGEGGTYSNLHALGFLDHTCRLDILLSGPTEWLARAVHEEYVRNQAGRSVAEKTTAAKLTWKELPEDLKESNRRQARHIETMLSAVGYKIVLPAGWDEAPGGFEVEEIEKMARMEHEDWLRERQSRGDKMGLHLAHWDELDEAAKEDNRKIVRAIPALLNDAGYQVYRAQNW